MVEKRRIAILAVRFGNGHWQAARVLKGALEEAYPGVQVEVINYLVFAGLLFDWLTRLAYHDLMIRIPWLYRRFFAYTNQLRPGSLFQRIINACGRRRFLRYLRRAEPVLLISTFPVPAAVASHLKRRGLINRPLVTVITDYTLHRQWLQPGTDLFIVANEALAEDMIGLGVPSPKVKATGIPVDPRFGERKGYTPGHLLPGLSPAEEKLPLVLVINGATSFGGELPSICRLLADFPLPLIGVVLGVRHPRLRLALRRAVRKRRNRVFILGYSRQVPEFMEAAACLISKTGGMTVSESLAAELPMIIYRPLPCQEEGNRDFLVQAGAALAPRSLEELAEDLKRLLTEPELRARMQKAASRLKKPDAARAAALLLEPYLNK
ncbi:MAG TPA: glycosyltransferase [Syntrophomonadaceae bacterium]|nr:glycosyltransferase [Syntrophomonadaceae bacterium]